MSWSCSSSQDSPFSSRNGREHNDHPPTTARGKEKISGFVLGANIAVSLCDQTYSGHCHAIVYLLWNDQTYYSKLSKGVWRAEHVNQESSFLVIKIATDQLQYRIWIVALFLFYCHCFCYFVFLRFFLCPKLVICSLLVCHGIVSKYSSCFDFHHSN